MPLTTLRHEDAFIMQVTEILKRTLSDRISPSLHMDAFLVLLFGTAGSVPLFKLPFAGAIAWSP